MSIISALKNRDENYKKYRLSLLKMMHDAVLNNDGEQFSFEWSVITKIIAFQKNDKGKWREHHRPSVDGDAWTAEKVMAELGLAGMYVKSYECLADDRPDGRKHHKHGIANVFWGYKYSFSISSDYANNLYRENYGEGKAFSNHLMYGSRHNIELLSDVLDNYLASYFGQKNIPTICEFVISKESIFLPYQNEDGGHRYLEYKFAGIGKSNLRDMHECYGMALAIVGFWKTTKWKDCIPCITYTRYFEGGSSPFSVYSDSIKFSVGFEPQKTTIKQLEEW
ncbi:MAG: hypothetical protein IJ448_04830 [Oscillospiraceae bacterium]|nr:hypothetical protein [Oscillospiraceae bacterium]